MVRNTCVLGTQKRVRKHPSEMARKVCQAVAAPWRRDLIAHTKTERAANALTAEICWSFPHPACHHFAASDRSAKKRAEQASTEIKKGSDAPNGKDAKRWRAPTGAWPGEQPYSHGVGARINKIYTA